ncbi:hypothetical protein [Rhizobium sp. Root708]|uniref:hypothetical protein n=1 Tax=Rhizobium sp. Root708 TaxID=1736592 RepID=UPI000A73A21C|nr:hypothetical protein [Rhizobium sp. Root708]
MTHLAQVRREPLCPAFSARLAVPESERVEDEPVPPSGEQAEALLSKRFPRDSTGFARR